MVEVEKATLDERTWHILHTTQGLFLPGTWYRPPCPGEVDSVQRMAQEWARHSTNALGIILVGDLNVHHVNWLKHSASVAPEGRALFDFCCAAGLEERVKKPTRGKHLLDLVLTELHTDVKCIVLPELAFGHCRETGRQKFSDHHPVLLKVALEVPTVREVPRECWNWSKARWKELNAELATADWEALPFLGDEPFEEFSHSATERFTEHLLETTRKYVPVTTKYLKKATHPWLNDKCRALVEEAKAAEGTPVHLNKLRACSEGILAEYTTYVEETKKKLKQLPRSSKAWWKLIKYLQGKAEKNSSIPTLKGNDGTWAKLPEEKAELLASTFLKILSTNSA